MRTADRTFAVAALLIGVPVAGAGATAQSARGQTDAPRAIPPAGAQGPSINIGSLDDPVGLEQQLRRLLRGGGAELRVTVPHGQARLGDFSLGARETLTGNLLVLRGDLDVAGRITGNVVALDGDIVLRAGAVVVGDALAIGGRIRDRGGVVQGEQRSLGGSADSPATAGALRTGVTRGAGLAGVLFTLGLLGFGLVLFARPNLETVSDTVTHNLFRSFLTGLLAQVLALPTFGMLITGLVLSVVGILLVPFVVIVFVLLLVTAIVGGFLAVAHAMGETRLRRRMAAGVMVGSANSYRYLLVGLGALAAFWMAWSVFGWVPVAGDLIRGAAILVTWLLGTAGFGAALLSRAGIRENFAGRLIPPEALTDEYLWATPQYGVTAAKRPGSRTPTRGL